MIRLKKKLLLPKIKFNSEIYDVLVEYKTNILLKYSPAGSFVCKKCYYS